MIKKILLSLITNQAGSVSSKIVIGIISFLTLLVTIISIMFINPDFPGLADLVTILIVTSASLLGLTTFENISQKKTKGIQKLMDQEELEERFEEES